MDRLTELAAHWRAESSLLRGYGAEQAAAACDRHALELEQALEVVADEALTLSEAATESGYSERRLRELLAEGAIPQAGRRGAPRIRRRDLPRRAHASNSLAYDAAADAASILGGG